MEMNALEMHAAEKNAMMQMDMSDDHDCCNDLNTYLKTGQMCKSGQTCSSMSAGLLPIILMFSPLAVETIFPPTLQHSPPSVYLLGVWRPPTFS